MIRPASQIDFIGVDQTKTWHHLESCPEAIELSRTNPALVHIVLSHLGRLSPAARLPLDWNRIFRCSQRSICAKVGLRNSTQAVNILRKLPSEYCTTEILECLRDLLADGPTSKVMAHLPRLTPGLITILHRPQLIRATGFTLLTEILADRQLDNSDYPLTQLEEYVGLLSRAKTPCSSHNITRIRSLDHLHRRLECLRNGLTPLPPPPLALPPHFKPLSSVSELISEGNAQGNCVGRYAPMVRARQSYIYSLEAPQRATVSMVLIKNHWQLNEIKCANNRRVRWDTEDYVADVIEKSQVDNAGTVEIPDIEYSELVNFAGGIVFDFPALSLPDFLTPITSPSKLLSRSGVPRDRMEELIDPIRSGYTCACDMSAPVNATVVLEASYVRNDGFYWEVSEIIPHQNNAITWEIHECVRSAVESAGRKNLPFA